jgi:hypothetical protein
MTAPTFKLKQWAGKLTHLRRRQWPVQAGHRFGNQWAAAAGHRFGKQWATAAGHRFWNQWATAAGHRFWYQWAAAAALSFNTTTCKQQVLFSKTMARCDGPTFFKTLGHMGVSLSPDSMTGSRHL